MYTGPTPQAGEGGAPPLQPGQAVTTAPLNASWRDSLSKSDRQKLLIKIVGALREVTDSPEKAKQMATQLESMYYRTANSYHDYFTSIAGKIYTMKKTKTQAVQQAAAAAAAAAQGGALQSPLKLPPSVPTMGPGPIANASMPKVPLVPSGLHISPAAPISVGMPGVVPDATQQQQHQQQQQQHQQQQQQQHQQQPQQPQQQQQQQQQQEHHQQQQKHHQQKQKHQKPQ
eukprot:TRINITY_DN8812_c0_g1_i2.p1 TRINITY_DN8812_c0_g1~~TRINITY_DN8812_c0_g1_i2.p1  ORF type:complete len:239 (-),score=98.56 TRINITY_DN8812_c0_g1_i2:115-801(-)